MPVGEDHEAIAHGDFVYRHADVPRFVAANGSRLRDSDGRVYLDLEAANGTASLGFDPSIRDAAVRRSSELPSLPSFCESDLRLEVAGELSRLLGEATGQHGRVAFELGGAQGVELATKVVRCNTPRTQLVVFEGGYHGRSIYTSQLSGSDRYRRINGGWRVPVHRLPYPDIDQGPYPDDPKEAVRLALFQLDQVTTLEVGGLADSSGRSDIAALIIEPVLNAGGIVKPDQHYLEQVVARFRELGALIVVDEIFCGFHRTGPMWGFQHYDFVPDVVIGSKALTNGVVPLAFVWARDPLMDPVHFPPGTHSATYESTPLGLAAASEVLARYREWTSIEDDLRALERRLRAMVAAAVEKYSLARTSWASGGLARILLDRPAAGELLDVARSVAASDPVGGIHGLILATTGMAKNVVAINPPLTITADEVEIAAELLDRSFAALSDRAVRG